VVIYDVDVLIVIFKLNFYILNISMIGLVMITLLHGNLNSQKLFNEIAFEGWVKWGKTQYIGKEQSTLDLILAIFLSLTKINFYNKNGSTILKSSNMFLRFRDYLRTNNINETLCLKTINSVNTVIKKNLKLILDITINQKVINNKCRNFG
jgi:hypothetical protein